MRDEMESGVLERGEYADISRAVGHSLDAQGARIFEIIAREGFMAVSWQDREGSPTSRTYRQLDVEQLREQARQMRTGDGRVGPCADQLRTPGQDAQGVAATRIIEDREGLHVAGTIEGQHFAHSYTVDEIRQLSEEGRSQRRDAAVTEPIVTTPSAAAAAPTAVVATESRPWWKRLLGIY